MRPEEEPTEETRLWRCEDCNTTFKARDPDWCPKCGSIEIEPAD